MREYELNATEKLLRLCYTCDCAQDCETEEMSVQCWAEQNVPAFEQEEGETQRLLRLYAE